MVRLHSSVVNDYEMGRGDSTMIHVLAHEKIIPPVPLGHRVVDYSSGRKVSQSGWLQLKKDQLD